MSLRATLTPHAEASRQAGRYLQASIVGTLANFFSRFAFAPFMGFGASLILANYVGMAVVFLLSYRRAFDMEKATGGMVLRFVTVAHVGLAVVWAVALLALYAARLAGKVFFPLPPERYLAMAGLPLAVAPWLPTLVEGACHAVGITVGFVFNFLGHRYFSFARRG
jgi:hypothetical protein